jgi:hypothetical protein
MENPVGIDGEILPVPPFDIGLMSFTDGIAAEARPP